MKNKISLIATIILSCIFGFIIFKGCSTNYVDFRNLKFYKTAIYKRVHDNGSIDKVFTIPPNKIILLKKKDSYFESGLFYVRFAKTTHYFGPVYNVSHSLFGLRIFNNAKKVWNAELTLKATHGNIKQTTYQSIGSSDHVRIIIYPNSITIGGLDFQKVDLNLDLLKIKRHYSIFCKEQ